MAKRKVKPKAKKPSAKKKTTKRAMTLETFLKSYVKVPILATEGGVLGHGFVERTVWDEINAGVTAAFSCGTSAERDPNQSEFPLNDPAKNN